MKEQQDLGAATLKTMTWANVANEAGGERTTSGKKGGGTSGVKSAYAPVHQKGGVDEAVETDGDEDTGDEEEDEEFVILSPPPVSVCSRCVSFIGLLLLMLIIVWGIDAAVVWIDSNGAVASLQLEAVNAAGAVASLVEQLENVTHRTKSSLQMAARDAARAARQRGTNTSSMRNMG